MENLIVEFWFVMIYNSEHHLLNKACVGWTEQILEMAENFIFV
jgi:hypothetical protein